MSSRACGLLLGFVADRWLGDPRRWHPVAGFGSLAGALESCTYADSKARGVGHVTGLVGAVIGAGVVADRLSGSSMARIVVTAMATWVVLGGRSLEREAEAVHSALNADDLPAARSRLTHLVGRDTSTLSPDEVARAVVESVAENTSDAVVAPLVWGAVAGAPGLLGYRAINTLDAMVGHRSQRYLRFGWAAARLDDVANLPGSRLAAVAALVASPATAQDGVRAWRGDAAGHPSPNAGVVEAAFAGVLGVRLGGVNHYPHAGMEQRAHLGDGRPCRPGDIHRAVRLARRVGVLCVGVAAAIAAAGAAAIAAARPSRVPPSLP